ncbi:BrnT family toxin [Treponema sp. SP13]
MNGIAIGFGSINGLVIVATIFIERDRIRIISSRLATKKEEA